MRSKHHVTITFLGEVAAERADCIVDAMNRVAGLHRAARTVDFSSMVGVSSFALMESMPTPSGTHYRRVHAVTREDAERWVALRALDV